MNSFQLNDEEKKQILSKYAEFSSLRGEPNQELDQYFVTQDTSLKRALLFQPEEYENKWIIFLGDMDLVGFHLGLLAKPKDLAVLDIDKRMPEIVFSMKFNYKIRSARYINHDLRIRMLAVLKNQYDFIFTESPMTIEGNEVFLSRAVQCAKKDGDSRIILSTDIKEEKKDELYSLFDQMNLEVEQHIKDFNKYSFKTVLGKTNSDLFILRVLENSKENIVNHYLGPMFFREIEQKTKPYRCKCGNIIEIGKEMSSVDELYEKGCPKCGHKEVFVYNSSIKLE
ncbi:MAG: bis-aminopropyl spermidine synthase family protein [Candidatus Heimdallarchaeum endolithica]|uniref:Bis-aminopropyl spermidine synthase family protein n=1 Tax=Candidatus Heimdallarchaeum endolithica TaxID=2876572 RepID=A0A9Y1FPI0_9ARCH|nr:MAG: bis-aminopropyl spermidine synthase family protein [Candidatus Heimdallarchaeum endolithica]